METEPDKRATKSSRDWFGAWLALTTQTVDTVIIGAKRAVHHTLAALFVVGILTALELYLQFIHCLSLPAFIGLEVVSWLAFLYAIQSLFTARSRTGYAKGHLDAKRLMLQIIEDEAKLQAKEPAAAPATATP